MTTPRFDLAGFTGAGYDKGRGALWQIAWMVVSGTIFVRWWCPASLRVKLLRFFGAEIGDGVLVRHRVRIHWPWKLSVGDHSQIGEGVWVLNLWPVAIGAQSVISQDVLLCTGSHDQHDPHFEFDCAPVVVGDGVWIATRATVLRGVTIGSNATIGATALVARDVPAGSTVLAPLATVRPARSERHS